LAKKDNKSHHDKGVRHHYNQQENENSFTQRPEPRLNQQQIAVQNLAQNKEEGNANYQQMQRQAEFSDEQDIINEVLKKSEGGNVK